MTRIDNKPYKTIFFFFKKGREIDQIWSEKTKEQTSLDMFVSSPRFFFHGLEIEESVKEKTLHSLKNSHNDKKENKALNFLFNNIILYF